MNECIKEFLTEIIVTSAALGASFHIKLCISI